VPMHRADCVPRQSDKRLGRLPLRRLQRTKSYRRVDRRVEERIQMIIRKSLASELAVADDCCRKR
jgi:hypothetical protein